MRTLWLAFLLGTLLQVGTPASAQVGLPLHGGHALGLDVGAPEMAVGHSYGHMFRGAFGSTVPYGWYSPWLRAPQTVKRKAHRPALYSTPRFGLQYNYPFAADRYPRQGLELPADTEEPLVAVQTSTYVRSVTGVDVALDFLRAGRYAEAGQLLSEELKQPQVFLDTYLAISEVLVATGNYKDASRVLLYGLSKTDDLRALEAVNVANDFPTSAEFTKHLEAIKADSSDSSMRFLDAALRLLSGDAAGLDAMRTLQEDSAVGSSAKKMFMYFLGLRFPTPKEEPATPAESSEEDSF